MNVLLLVSSSALQLPSSSFIRDAEIKHGRVAMTSAVVLSALADQGFEHPSAVLSQCSISEQAMFFSGIGLLESSVYLPRLSYGFRLKSDVTEGNIFGGDPPPNLSYLEDMWGRIAMLGVATFMLADGTQLLA